MAADIKIYKQQHEALIIAETKEGIDWVLEHIQHWDGVITFRIPSDCIGDIRLDLVKASLIVELR